MKFPPPQSETPKTEYSEVGRKLVKFINTDPPVSIIERIEIS